MLQKYNLEEGIIFPQSFSERTSETSHYALVNTLLLSLPREGSMKQISNCLCICSLAYVESVSLGQVMLR